MYYFSYNTELVTVAFFSIASNINLRKNLASLTSFNPLPTCNHWSESSCKDLKIISHLASFMNLANITINCVKKNQKTKIAKKKSLKIYM